MKLIKNKSKQTNMCMQDLHGRNCWASEGVYEAGNVQSSEAEDSRGCNNKHLNTMEQKKRMR